MVAGLAHPEQEREDRAVGGAAVADCGHFGPCAIAHTSSAAAPAACAVAPCPLLFHEPLRLLRRVLLELPVERLLRVRHGHLIHDGVLGGQPEDRLAVDLGVLGPAQEHGGQNSMQLAVCAGAVPAALDGGGDLGLEPALVAVRRNAQEAELRIKLVDAVLDGSAGETPAVHSLECCDAARGIGALVLDVLGLVEHDAVELGASAEEGGAV